MKNISIIALTLLFTLTGSGQDRITSIVMFESGDEKIEGILVRPNLEDKTPVVIFQQGSGPMNLKVMKRKHGVRINFILKMFY